MADYLIRGVPAETWDKLKAKAASEHKTLKALLLEHLTKLVNV